MCKEDKIKHTSRVGRVKETDILVHVVLTEELPEFLAQAVVSQNDV